MDDPNNAISSPFSPRSPEVDEEFMKLVEQLTAVEPTPPAKSTQRNPQRTTSAPPDLELQQDQIFAFQPLQDYARFFTDIRCDRSYFEFYNFYRGQLKLPPPLETNFLKFYRPVAASERHLYERDSNPISPASMTSSLTSSERLNPVDTGGDSDALSNTPQLLSSEAPLPRIEYGGIEEGSSMSISKRNLDVLNKSRRQKGAIMSRRRSVENASDEGEDAQKSSSGERKLRISVSNEELPQSSQEISDRSVKQEERTLPMPKFEKSRAVSDDSNDQKNAATEDNSGREKLESKEKRETADEVQSRDEISKKGDFDDDSTPASSQMYYYQTQRPVCKFFQNGYCQYGSNCQFLHILPTQAPNSVMEEVNPDNKMQEAAVPNATSSSTASPQRQLKPRKEVAKYTSLSQMVGEIYPICKEHQKGSRFLQKKLEEGDPKEVATIFDEVIDHVIELMTDPFGNYFIQKLMEAASAPQNLEIIKRSSDELVRISLNVHGTRVVQKMVDKLSTPEQTQLVVASLNDNVVELIKDLNGNHVIQRCLQKLRPKFNQFVYDSVADNCIEIASHKHGCCVMQRCIDHASPSQKMMLIEEIIRNALFLVEDPYGNYVVQYIVDLKEEPVIERLSEVLCEKVVDLSVQKFSSNVIEKCLQNASAPVRSSIIHQLCGSSRLSMLLQDAYANYVIQTAMNLADEKDFPFIAGKIKPQMSKIRGSPQGKRIQAKLNRMGFGKS